MISAAHSSAIERREAWLTRDGNSEGFSLRDVKDLVEEAERRGISDATPLFIAGNGLLLSFRQDRKVAGGYGK